MDSITVQLSNQLMDYLESQSKEGNRTPAEYVQELIVRDRRIHRAKEQLETLLVEGLESGDPIPADEKFWDDLVKEAHEVYADKKRLAG